MRPLLEEVSMRDSLLRCGAVAAAVLFVAVLVPHVAASQESKLGSETEMNCRVLETHVIDSPAVIAVLFHQRDKQDQAEFASALVTHTGEKVQVRFGNGDGISGTVVRLKSCFGRGLLFLPRAAPPIKERDTFTLRFAPVSQK
jgi:hypothetical protein